MNNLGMYCGYCQREYWREIRSQWISIRVDLLTQSILRLAEKHRQGLRLMLATAVAGGVILAEVYTFLVQLAEFGW